MSRKYSVLKFNIIVILFFWSQSMVYGILKSFDIGTLLSYCLLAAFAVLSVIFLYKRYKPFLKTPGILESSLLLGEKYVFDNQIIHTYEIGILGKILFAVKNPECDYSSKLFARGIIIKTLYETYLMDDLKAEFIESKKINKTNRGTLQNFLFYILYLVPIIVPVITFSLSIDPLWYVVGMLIFAYFVVLRLLPPFYLAVRIEPSVLPLSHDEIMEFRHITILEGFALSDRVRILPFKRASCLDGLAVDLLFKKYIVLNPRLFALGSRDYLRFVIFHELCHIKHHDGTGAAVTALLIVLLDVLFSVLPLSIDMFLPYYDYILVGAAAIYFIAALFRRKKIELRADRYGTFRIGENGVSNVKRELGVDLIK